MLEETTLENFSFLLKINSDATAQYQTLISLCLISFSFAVFNFPASGFISQKGYKHNKISVWDRPS